MNESPKNKNEYPIEVNMADRDSQTGEVNVEESYYSQVDGPRKSYSEIDQESGSVVNTDGRRE